MSTQLAKAHDVRKLINSDAMKEQIARALPKHMTPDRFLRVMTTTALRVPKLADCNQESLIKAMMDCSALGLEPDGRRAHLIPYGKDCQLIIDWKGLIELAKRSGEVETWNTFIVYSGDDYSWENGLFTHKADPFAHDRGEPVGAVSVITNKSGSKDFELMSKDEILAIKKRSKAGSSGPWVTDELEMWRKTVLRRHSKRVTLSPEFNDALEKDFDKFEDLKRAVVQEIKPAANPLQSYLPEAPTVEEPEVIEPAPKKKAPAKKAATKKAAPSEPVTIFSLADRDGKSDDEVLGALERMSVVESGVYENLSDIPDEAKSKAVDNWELVTASIF